MQIDKTNDVYESNAKAKALADLEKLKVELAEAEVADSAADADVDEARKLLDTAELRVNLLSLQDVDHAQAKADLRNLVEALAKARTKACVTGAEVSEVQKLVETQELRMDVVFLSVICTGTDPLKDRIIELGVVGENGGELLSLRFNPGVPIPPSTTHTITDEDVAELPLFETCSDALFEVISKKKVVVHDLMSHNAEDTRDTRYEYSMMISDFLNGGLSKTGIAIQQVSGQAIYSNSFFRPTPYVSALEQAQKLRKNYLGMLVA